MVTESLLFVGMGIAVLLCISAFFSASEIAVFSLERHRVSALRDGSDKRGAVLARLREDPHRLLVTILVGNNVVNISMASIATVAVVSVFGAGVGVTIATVVMSILILLVGEIAPKSYGVANAERTALRFARPLSGLQRVLYPIVVVFEWIATRINVLTGSETVDRPELTRAELERLVATGEQVGAIGRAEREMVEGIFELESTTAREVMVPRPNVTAVDRETSLTDIVGLCADRRLTRVPVYEGTLDNVVGVVDIRDAERALRKGLALSDVMTQPLIIPDSQRIDALLAEMQAQRQPLVVVVDEYGEMEGIITIEDILEEIVGDIFAVGEERLVRPTTDGLVVKGEVTVGEINDILNIDLPRLGDYETVAGLINTQLGRLGEVGDVVEFPAQSVTLTVDAVERNRIRRVQIRRLALQEPAVDETT
jgi:CBS domain containing-hemolysin-like protein